MIRVLVLSVLVLMPLFGHAEGELKSNFLEVDGDKYHYLSMGDESRPLMLFVHGFPEFSYTWREQLKYFSDRFYAVAVDMKGYNLSSKPKDVAAYKSTHVAEGLYKFAKKLSPTQPIFLVAHDWGGSISWLMASAHKEFIKALVILNVGHPLLFFREYTKGPGGGSPRAKPAQYDLSVYIRNIRSGLWDEKYYSNENFKAFAEVVFDNSVGSSRRFFDEDTKKAYMKAWSQVDPATQVSSLTASLNYYRAMDVPEPGFWVQKKIWFAQLIKKLRVEVPTLVLWGKGDTFVAESVNDGLGGLVPDLTFKAFDGLTHWILHEDPDLVNREIEEFLGKRFAEVAKKLSPKQPAAGKTEGSDRSAAEREPASKPKN